MNAKSPLPPVSQATANGLAVLLAALRDDRPALVHLLDSANPAELRQMLLFCAFYAADQARAVEQARPGLDTHQILQGVALRLAE